MNRYSRPEPSEDPETLKVGVVMIGLMVLMGLASAVWVFLRYGLQTSEERHVLLRVFGSGILLMMTILFLHLARRSKNPRRRWMGLFNAGVAVVLLILLWGMGGRV
jgi:hypothetical protein